MRMLFTSRGSSATLSAETEVSPGTGWALAAAQ